MIFFASAVSACSCVALGNVGEEFAKSGAVFLGSAEEVSESGEGFEILFSVSENFKGEFSEVSVFTAADSAACGFNFVEGEDYLVYASGTEENLEVSLCSRTANVENAVEDLDILRAGELSALCTADAKICPDGSYVGRNPGNNCEFYECPSVGSEDSGEERPFVYSLVLFLVAAVLIFLGYKLAKWVLFVLAVVALIAAFYFIFF